MRGGPGAEEGPLPGAEAEAEARAEWACAEPEGAAAGEWRDAGSGAVRFRVPPGMTQQTASAADPHELRYVFTEGPRRLEVRLSRRSVCVGALAGAQCWMGVAGRPAEARLRARNGSFDRYTADLKWRGVSPAPDLMVTATAPDREGLEELRRVFWTFRLPGARAAGRE